MRELVKPESFQARYLKRDLNLLSLAIHCYTYRAKKGDKNGMKPESAPELSAAKSISVMSVRK